MTYQNSLPSSDQLPQNFTRREMLMGLLASVGAVATAGCVQQLDKHISTPAQTAGKPANTLGFYTESEFELVQRLSDLIIPTTDTPGAVAAGVPKLMDQLFVQWASASSQQMHRAAINSINQDLNALTKADFISAHADTQLQALKALDEQTYSSNRYKNGQYRGVKSLIAKCYYATEPGATQELRYERVPGRWEPCIPFEQVGRTWAK